MAPLFRAPKGFRPNLDPALDDAELVQARRDMQMGRWESGRHLLARTGKDWDRRAHRISVLADALATTHWADEWLGVEPRSPDAATLRAWVEVVRAEREEGRPWDLAEQACWWAVELDDADPVPWACLLELARYRPTPADRFWSQWDELRARDPYLRDGFHLALQYLYARWCGSRQDMYDFAWWAAQEAPVGSPLAVLPLVAHAEQYRELRAQGTNDPAILAAHWRQPAVEQAVDFALRHWLALAPPPHARALADRNHLLYALLHVNRLGDARAQFAAVGEHMTEEPWRFSGDPAQFFTRWRGKLLTDQG
jgi:hypothetical protein